MKCMKCGKETYRSTNTEAIELGEGRLLIVRNIPCYKCRRCDEIFYTGDIVEQLERLTKDAAEHSRELTIIDYTRAA